MPVLIDCNFIVDSTNGNGLGIRSLKGPGVANVYMHTSATPAPGNPNPAAGTILVQLQDNYNRYFGGFTGFEGPVGTPTTSTTAGTPVFITSLGTATLAQWQTAGLPVGLTPTVGQAFVPLASGVIGGSASVAPIASGGAGIDHIEAIGDPNTTLNPVPNQGGQMLFQCYDAGTITAPANGSTISLAFYLSNSSVQVQGE